jgi:hypothetical protein
VDGSKVGVFEKRDEVCFSSFLKSHNSGGLETQVGLHRRVRIMLEHKTTTTHLKVLGDLTDKSLEGKFANEKFGRLLVPPDFTQSDGSGPETVRLLDSTSDVLKQYESVSIAATGKSLHQPGLSFWRLWWRVAYEEPFLKTLSVHNTTINAASDTNLPWTCEQFAWYGPLMIFRLCVVIARLLGT